ncbi:MAG: pilin [Candidatus Pacebacteria bacterium]|nr:pilin [Candidatus Paceibacterota bacterium]
MLYTHLRILKTFIFVIALAMSQFIFAQTANNPVSNITITPDTISGDFSGGLSNTDVIFTLVGVNNATNQTHESQLAEAPGQSQTASFSFTTPSNLTVYNNGTIVGEVTGASYTYTELQIDLVDTSTNPNLVDDNAQSFSLGNIIQNGEDFNPVTIDFPGWEDPPVADSFALIPNGGGTYYPILRSNFTINGDVTTTRTPADAPLHLIIENKDTNLPMTQRFGRLQEIPGGSASFNINFPPNCPNGTCQLPTAAQLQPGGSYAVFLSSIWVPAALGSQNAIAFDTVPYGDSENHYFNLHQVPGGSIDDGGDDDGDTNGDNDNGNSGNDGNNNNNGSTGQNSTPYSSSQTDIINNGIVPNCGYNLTDGGRLCGFSDLIKLVQRGIEYIFILVVPIVAITFAYAGYLYLTSGGNSSKRDAAKNAMTKSLIGIVVVMSAWLIVTLILRTLGASDAVTQFLDI